MRREHRSEVGGVPRHCVRRLSSPHRVLDEEQPALGCAVDREFGLYGQRIFDKLLSFALAPG
jgi:hypothetical protein